MSIPLPSWASKQPEDGALIVPGKLKEAIARALGPLDRKYGITQSVRMVATRGASATWGLQRSFELSEGAGPELARVLEVLAQHELPLIGAELARPMADRGKGTAAEILRVALAPAAVAHLRQLTISLRAADAVEVDVLARAVARMTSLAVLALDLGSASLAVVEGAPALRSLKLDRLGAADLSSLARLPAVRKLESLALLNVDADEAALTSLLQAPWASGLRELEMTRKLLAPSDYRAVARLPAVVSLKLRFPDAASVAAIADAAFVPALQRLELHDCRIDAPLAKRFASRGLPDLQRLVVKHCEMSDAALRVMVEAAPRLKELGIPKTTRPQGWSGRGRMVF